MTTARQMIEEFKARNRTAQSPGPWKGSKEALGRQIDEIDRA